MGGIAVEIRFATSPRVSLHLERTAINADAATFSQALDGLIGIIEEQATRRALQLEAEAAQVRRALQRRFHE